MLPAYSQASKDERVYPAQSFTPCVVTSSDFSIEIPPEKAEYIKTIPAWRGASRRSNLRKLIVALAVMSTLLLLSCSQQEGRLLPLAANQWDVIRPKKVVLPHVYDGPQTTNKVNSTLGFEKIIALNLPRRMDKKDELINMGYASDIQIDFLSTRLGKDLEESGLPYHIKFDGPGPIGGWRAHVDAWQKVVNERISTALILEDDSDWDVDIKAQLQRAHQPLATLIESLSHDNKTRASTAEDPWLHQDWDVLMLGYCLESAFTQDRHPGDVNLDHTPHVLFDDRTVADRGDTSEDIAAYMDHYGYTLPRDDLHSDAPIRRVVTRAHAPICLSAYAVSLRGASRLLYHQTRGLDSTVDLAFADLVETGKLKGYEIMPPIMSQWKVKDAGLKNSDLDMANASDRERERDNDSMRNHNPSIGESTHIRNSIRKHLEEILVRK